MQSLYLGLACLPDGDLEAITHRVALRHRERFERRALAQLRQHASGTGEQCVVTWDWAGMRCLERRLEHNEQRGGGGGHRSAHTQRGYLGVDAVVVIRVDLDANTVRAPRLRCSEKCHPSFRQRERDDLSGSPSSGLVRPGACEQQQARRRVVVEILDVELDRAERPARARRGNLNPMLTRLPTRLPISLELRGARGAQRGQHSEVSAARAAEEPGL